MSAKQNSTPRPDILKPHRAGDVKSFPGGKVNYLSPTPLPTGTAPLDFNQAIGEVNDAYLGFGGSLPTPFTWQVVLGFPFISFLIMALVFPTFSAVITSNSEYSFLSEFKIFFEVGFEMGAWPHFANCEIAVKFTCPGLRYGEFQLPSMGASADYLAPVPYAPSTYQYYPLVKGQRLLALTEVNDSDDNAIRYIGFQLPDRWHQMSIPTARWGVDADWLRNSVNRFQYEEGYKQEYHQGLKLARLYFDDLTGQGTIQFWDRASRTYQSIEDEMTFTTHPASLTWVCPQKGNRR